MSCETLLPTNIDEKLNVLDLVGCERVEELKNAIEKVEKFNDPLTIDEEFLELLADEFEVQFWSPIVELEKRKLINASKAYYRKLGTVWAIKEVLKVLDIESRLAEWFDYEGEPYHFKVVLSPVNKEQTFDENEFKKIVGLIDSVKNVRSVLDGFEFELFFDEEIKVYSGFGVKPKIDKDVSLELSGQCLVNSIDSAVFSTQIDRDAEVDNSFKCSFSSIQTGVIKPKLDRDASLEFKLDSLVNSWRSMVFNSQLARNINIENKFNSEFFNFQFQTFNYKISKKFRGKE